MKQFLKTSFFSFLAAAPFLSLTAQAGDDPVIYTQQTPTSAVRVLVYQDGEPAENAKVQIFGNGGNLRNEYMTDSDGRLVISHLSAPGPLKVVAQTSQGSSAPQMLSLYSNHEK